MHAHQREPSTGTQKSDRTLAGADERASAATKLLAAQNRILSRIAAGCSVPELAREVLDFIENHGIGWSAAIHLVEPTSERLTAGVSKSLPGTLVRGMEDLPLTEAWPAGSAVMLSSPVRSHPDDGAEWCTSYRDLAEAHGLGGCWSVPASSSAGDVLAMVSAFSAGDSPDSERLPEVLDIASSLLGTGVERLRIVERLRLAQSSIDQGRDPALYVREDASFLYVNNAACRAFGYERRELLEMRVQDLEPRLGEREFRRLWKVSARRGGLKMRAEIKRKDGALVPVEVTIAFVRVEDQGYQCTLIRNISEQKRTETRLRECEERYALAARGANDGLWDWDFENGQMRLSPRWCSLLGLGESELRTSPAIWWKRVHPDDEPLVRERLEEHLSGAAPVFQSEHRMLHADGRALWVLCRGEAIRTADGKPKRVAGSLTDITKQKLAEERLRHDALHDDLTGLPNRSLFMNHLGRLLERARFSERLPFAVLFLDFDRFKRINDSLGHMTGDELLIAAAERLNACVRPGDLVARLGGDEFSILLERVSDVGDATRVAERIHHALRDPFQLSGMEVLITASIGIALSSPTYNRPEDLLRDADTAMYRAKAAGRARHEVFDQEMHARVLEQLKLESELRRAVQRQEFCLFYQPVVTLEDRSIVGFEALTRWRHPTRGLLSPGAFLVAAEESGLIVDIGWWIFREACRQMTQWKAEYPAARELTIHVNLSDKQLFQPELPEQIEEVLGASGLLPKHVVLDIPENVIMQKAESSVTILGQLRSLGLRIHLDDFGTGYSSLGYLHRFQIDTLKIDRSFIRHLRSGSENWITVRSILSLAENLRMDVIAEGVENDEQLHELLKLGCNRGQGSLFYRPLTDVDVTKLLRQLDSR